MNEYECEYEYVVRVWNAKDTAQTCIVKGIHHVL